MAITNVVKNPNENKKRRRSKRTKLSWRKHCDVKDVDAFLEEKLLEERLGTPFAERKDEDLFQIDTQPDTSQIRHVLSSKSLKRKAAQTKPLKCYQVLKSQSAVSDPISKRNRVLTKEEKHPLVTRLNEERLKQGVLKEKEMIQIKNQAIARAKKESKRKKDEVTSDLWGEDTKRQANPFGSDGEWLYETTLMHTLKNTRQMQKTIPNSIYKKLSHLSAVETPHPGMSYNPSFEDHQALLKEVAESEAKVIKEEKHLARVTSKMFTRLTESSKQNNWMTEMSEELPNKEEQTSGEDSDYMAINPPAKNAKKPLQKRRKMKEARAEEVERKRAKQEKKKISDLHRLTVLHKEMVVVDEKIEKLRNKRAKVKSLRALEPRQLNQNKFKAADLEFNMRQDIKGNLRSVKTEGSLIADRYNSLQKRNVVAPSSGRQHVKKGKMKEFEKSTYKMGWEPKGY